MVTKRWKRAIIIVEWLASTTHTDTHDTEFELLLAPATGAVIGRERRSNGQNENTEGGGCCT